MFKLVVRHELKIALGTWPAWVAWITLGLATFGATAGGIIRVQRERESEADFRRHEQARQDGFKAKVLGIERQIADGAPESAFPRVSSTFRERNPVVVGGPFAKAGRSAILPPTPLAALAVGQADLLPEAIAMTTGSHSRLPRYESNASPLQMMVGYFDLTFVILYLLPICLIALCFDLISGEREQGTLALLRSFPVSLGTLLAAKCTVRALPLILLPLVGLSAIGLTASGDAVDRLLPTGIGGLAILTYGCFWVALALIVNAAGRSSAFNATALALAWILILVAFPSAGSLAAGLLHPSLSRAGYVNHVRDLEEALPKRDATEVLSRYLTAHPELAAAGELAPVPRYYALETARGELLDEMLAPSQAAFSRATASQRKTLSAWALFSPAISLYEILTSLSGTDGWRHGDFIAKSQVYHREWKRFFMPRILADAPFTAADFDRIPLFQYEEPGGGAVLERVWVPVVCLLAGTVLAVLIATRRINRAGTLAV